MAKASRKEQVEEQPEVEVEEVEAVEPEVEVEPAEGRPSPRRAPGQKEVIPFAFKVCGYSFDGHTLTLFKSVERTDCEAQLARLQAEGYYENLGVYGINDPVPESPAARKLRAAAAKKAKQAEKAAEESANALSKGVKTPAAVKTAMGKLVDGRLTIPRKKSTRGLDLGGKPKRSGRSSGGAPRPGRSAKGQAPARKAGSASQGADKAPAPTSATGKRKEKPVAKGAAKTKTKPRPAGKTRRKPSAKSGKAPSGKKASRKTRTKGR